MRPLQAFINLSLTCSLRLEGLKKKWLRIIRSVGKGGREARLSNFFSSSLPTPSPLPPSSISSHFLLPPSSTRKPVDRLNPYICSIEQEGQRRLTEVADDTVIRVTAGQERLVRQQAKLHASYDDVQRSISFSLRGNVRALHQERMMIDSGRKQLKEMAKTVLDKLGLFIWEFFPSTSLGYRPAPSFKREPAVNHFRVQRPSSENSILRINFLPYPGNVLTRCKCFV